MSRKDGKSEGGKAWYFFLHKEGKKIQANPHLNFAMKVGNIPVSYVFHFLSLFSSLAPFLFHSSVTLPPPFFQLDLLPKQFDSIYTPGSSSWLPPFVSKVNLYLFNVRQEKYGNKQSCFNWVIQKGFNECKECNLDTFSRWWLWHCWRGQRFRWQYPWQAGWWRGWSNSWPGSHAQSRCRPALF